MIIKLEQSSYDMVEETGQKGASLGEMIRMGLDVPDGFIISTGECRKFFEQGGRVSDELFEEVVAHVRELEGATNSVFGSGERRPLLLSVRSGAAVSMPGMMETVLNLGMGPQTVLSMTEDKGDARFAFDCYQRFVRMFGGIVYGIDRREFDTALQYQFDRAGVYSLDGLSPEHLRELIEKFTEIIKSRGRGPIPEDPLEQLRMAIEAVFRSWNSPRAKVYRNYRRVPHDKGTAVVVQIMVYGNIDAGSAVGAVTSRDPIMGNRSLFGEYLAVAQGEEIQDGTRKPGPIARMQEDFPGVYAVLSEAMERMERRFRSVQSVEFTIESGRLYFLQTRNAECTARATIQSGVDMVNEGLIGKEEAVLRVKPETLDQILFRYVDPEVQMRSLVRGQAASPGAAYGLVVFSASEAVAMRKENKDAILVRNEARPEDMEGMEAASGIIIGRGGRSSHALANIRRMGKPCVAGFPGLEINREDGRLTVGGVTVNRGEAVTIDGSSGRIFLGTVKMWESTIGEEFRLLLDWADGSRTLHIRANADTPEDVTRAVEFGAEGIGLCRTEAMFMAGDRLPTMQTLVLAEELAEQQKLLARLQEFQRGDFVEMFRILEGKPVTFRLLDPPLHEFIPDLEPLMMDVYEMRSQERDDETLRLKEALLKRVISHREVNPMLGLRGCRLGLLRPDIVRMQVSAVFEAACEVMGENVPVNPEILIPLVGHVNELIKLRELISDTARSVMERLGRSVNYRVGVLIEVPRAALTAADLAQHADFFSFGTNDLTQSTFALSRDDSEHKFLANYLGQRILQTNPFQTLDPDGVGRLIRIAVGDGRSTNPNLILGLCGEHGADPATVVFCHNIGIDYVSCSPYQVPIARLAAAQARIRQTRLHAENDNNTVKSDND